MRAAVRTRYGSPDVVTLQEIETPVATDDKVLVRVHASSVNRADLDYLTGTPAFARIFTGLRAPKIRRLGLDVAGTVEAIGPNVTKFKPGDAVFGDMTNFGYGAFAEYVCASERAFALNPENTSFEDTATVPQAGIDRPARLALQTADQGRASSADQRRVGQCRPDRRPDREGARRGGDRRLQHEQDGDGARRSALTTSSTTPARTSPDAAYATTDIVDIAARRFDLRLPASAEAHRRVRLCRREDGSDPAGPGARPAHLPLR